MKNITLQIQNMHCSSCAMNIDFELEDLKGIKEAKTSYIKQFSQITYDDQKITPKEMISAIEKLGYKAILQKQNGK